MTRPRDDAAPPEPEPAERRRSSRPAAVAAGALTVALLAAGRL